MEIGHIILSKGLGVYCFIEALKQLKDHLFLSHTSSQPIILLEGWIQPYLYLSPIAYADLLSVYHEESDYLG